MSNPYQNLIEPRRISFDGFPVARYLPRVGVRSVGPWVFFDHMGPFDFPAGGGMDVPPHPHIDLATVTYLFEGAILHRDTLGNRQLIEPGAINLMTAGKGIAHSERSPDDLRNAGHRVHGLQLWHALPAETEGCEPAFDHYPEEDIPSVRTHGVEIRVLMGTAYGRISPVKDLAGALYLEYRMDGESSMIIPALADERAMYLIDGTLSVDGVELPVGRLALLEPGSRIVQSGGPCRFVIIGGKSLGRRYMWWNFVSSKRENIEAAMEEWKNGSYPAVVDDPGPPVPLPESDSYSFMKD